MTEFDVRLRDGIGREYTETVEASVLSTSAGVIDMARQRAGLSPREFATGEVL